MAKQTNEEQLIRENESLRKKLNLSTIVIILLVVALCAVTIVLNTRS